MKNTKNKIILLVISDLIILLICGYGLHLVHQKANLPFTITSKDSSLIVKETHIDEYQVEVGDTLISLDNFYFQSWQEIELYIDGKVIGDKVNVAFLKNGSELKSDVQLIAYYTTFDIMIMASVGFIFILLALVIRIKAGENKSAEIFHWASVGLGVVIVCTAGTYALEPAFPGYFARILWLFAYNITPVIFIHFTISFISIKFTKSKLALRILYTAAIINSVILSYFFLDYALNQTYTKAAAYTFYFEAILRIFVLICVVSAISICIYAYRKSEDREERKRLMWLLFGFFIGPFSFVLFWILPIILIGYTLLPEFIILILLVAIPVSFGIAIIKYHFLNISFIVNRSVLYSIVLAGLIITFVIISSAFAFLFHEVFPIGEIQSAVPFIISAVLVSLLLQPAKKRVQTFVDKRFFRLEYDFREEQRKFLEELKNIHSVEELAQKLVVRTDELIPVEKIGFFIVEKPQIRIKLVSQKGFDLLTGRSLKFEEEKLKTDLSNPIAVDDKIEKGVKIESADIAVFRRWGMVLVLPIKSVTGEIHAFLVLGGKKSGKRFYKDDIDLLNSVTTAAALSIDRINLLQALIIKQLETKKLQELNEAKSFFVGMLTHELKTPLTPIKMNTEKLEDRLPSEDKKSLEYLEIIAGETEKLKRLIENILDFGTIEKGIKSYRMEEIELNEIVRKVVSDLKYQFIIAKQKFKHLECDYQIFIHADGSALERAISNLITNASKYSDEGSTTTISVSIKNGFASVEVKDEGRGIPEDDQAKIFDAYFRANDERKLKANGTGLGLAIVKHIIDAHDGRIEFQSKVGKGSTFTLLFPLIKYEKNIIN